MSKVPVQYKRPPGARWGLLAALGRRMAELAVVFTGVYAAFLLNNYQQHRQERQRREQVLAWMDQTYSDWYAALDAEQVQRKREADVFDAKLAAGEMPPVKAYNVYSDYNPSDIAVLLQSGGFDLLDVPTIRDLKEVDTLFRQMVGVVQHEQHLSDALILPNLGKDSTVFYDPATSQLRPSYEWYGKSYKVHLSLYADLHKSLKKLLGQIHIARANNR